MSKLSARDLSVFAQLDALYTRLPTIACKGKCAGACGAIPMTDAEARRLQVTAHKKPRTLPMAATAQGGAATERCVYLSPTNRCTVYAVRPLICRVWGIVNMLSCPFGCTPSEWWDELQYCGLAKEIERIGGGRVVRTSPEGLTVTPGENYAGIPINRTPEQIRKASERTRNLRALHGGRILIAMDERD